MSADSTGDETGTSPTQIRKVGIVGSGIMGSGLAEVASRAGFQVVVRSRKRDSAEAMVSMIDKGLIRAIERGKATDDDRSAILGRITATDHLGALADCDLVIESVVEDLDVKKRLFIELEEIVKSSGIIATNTSTLPVVELAMVTQRPDQVCGIHFFNPATMMSLVEVIRPVTASDATIATAMAFAAACGKDAVEVKDRAGFIVNALLFPYLNNAVRMAEAGTASMASIDTAMKGGCNFPMGPFALLDLVGLDTSLSILDALYDEFRDPNYAAVPLLRRMVAAGQLGRKTKRGFYTY
ncbi:MAG: 3-hydroxybutyryl-CoA dehydrogenase [Ilumatobacteraceae bacterium]